MRSSLKRLASWARLPQLYVAVIAGVAGTALLVVSRAATPTVTLETETGSINAPAASVNDSSASGGAAVKFGVRPVGIGGNWDLQFDDEFNGSGLDTTKWYPDWYGEGGSMNRVGTYAANVSVSGGDLMLTLASSTSGAAVHTGSRYQFAVGDYAEARVYFPGNGTVIDNWPAWWASGANWPAAGEHDIAEGLGTLTVNYHSPSGSHNQGTVPGNWANAFHVYAVHRNASSTDVYWDGQLVKSYPTDDNGGGQELILNVGSGSNAVYGTASQVKVDYVRAWQPAP